MRTHDEPALASFHRIKHAGELNKIDFSEPRVVIKDVAEKMFLTEAEVGELIRLSEERGATRPSMEDMEKLAQRIDKKDVVRNIRQTVKLQATNKMPASTELMKALNGQKYIANKLIQNLAIKDSSDNRGGSSRSVSPQKRCSICKRAGHFARDCRFAGNQQVRTNFFSTEENDEDVFAFKEEENGEHQEGDDICEEVMVAEEGTQQQESGDNETGEGAEETGEDVWYTDSQGELHSVELLYADPGKTDFLRKGGKQQGKFFRFRPFKGKGKGSGKGGKPGKSGYQGGKSKDKDNTSSGTANLRPMSSKSAGLIYASMPAHLKQGVESVAKIYNLTDGEEQDPDDETDLYDSLFS